MNRKNVAIVGPLPPPRGGASVHVVRLAQLLASMGANARVLPWAGLPSRRRWLRALGTARQFLGIAVGLWKYRGGVVHVHYSHLPGLFVLAPWILMMPARWALTLHSVKLFENLESAPTWQRRLAWRLVSRFDLVVCVRQGIEDALREWGGDSVATVIMPAFLPPAEAERRLEELPDHVARDIALLKEQGRLLLGCAAYVLGPAYGKDDLYGAEMLVDDLVAVAPEIGRPITLMVMVSNAPVGEAQEAARAMVRRAEQSTAVELRIATDLPLVPVLAHAHGFARPSREDGDSVAIREALAVGCPVWASDAVNRPAECVVFPLSDATTRRESLLAFLKGVAAEQADEPVGAGADDDRFRRFAELLMGWRSA